MPLFRRRRPVLRAAAVGGGAYAFGKHRQRKQEEEQEQAYYAGQQSAQAAAPPPAAPPAPPARHQLTVMSRSLRRGIHLGTADIQEGRGEGNSFARKISKRKTQNTTLHRRHSMHPIQHAPVRPERRAEIHRAARAFPRPQIAYRVLRAA